MDQKNESVHKCMNMKEQEIFTSSMVQPFTDFSLMTSSRESISRSLYSSSLISSDVFGQIVRIPKYFWKNYERLWMAFVNDFQGRMCGLKKA